MLKKVVVAVAVLLALFVAITALQPEDFRISRSLTMKAAPNAVFNQVNNLKKWNSWSPWAKLDPNAKNTFEGPKAGKGAVLRWDGNNDVGAGAMTIVESKPSSLVKFQLDFLRPFAATHTAEFTFKSVKGGTEVTWSMYGKNNFVGKAMGLIMNCDKMVGGEFEKGLADLKKIVEGQ